MAGVLAGRHGNEAVAGRLCLIERCKEGGTANWEWLWPSDTPCPQPILSKQVTSSEPDIQIYVSMGVLIQNSTLCQCVLK